MFDIVDNTVLRAYHGNESFVDVPLGVKVIDESAFQDNCVLEEIQIPEGVEKIAYEAFSGCHALRRVSLPTSLQFIDRYAFSNCDSLHQIVIPGETVVRGDAFYRTPLEMATLLRRTDHNDGIHDTKLRLAANLCPFCEHGQMIFSVDRKTCTCDTCGQRIDENQRRDLMTLQMRNGVLFGAERNGCLYVPEGIRKIQSRAFDDSYIQEADIPDSVTEIGVGAFAWCDRMRSVHLPAGLRRIEASCFNLATITEIEIPEATEYVGRHAFSGSAIRRAVFNSRLKVICGFAFYGANNLKAVALPHGLEILGEHAFSHCESLEAVVIPGGVATIENGVFETCERLQQVIIEEGVTQIGDRAFKECISLQKIVIPDSVLLIGRDAFAECDMLREAELPVHLKGVCESAFPVHTKFHYRTPSLPSNIECLILSLPNADYYDRYTIMETIRNAAEAGDVTAMMHMAKCYQFGRYLVKSKTNACSWYEKAAAKGCLQAKWRLLSMQKHYDPDYRVDLYRLVRAGCKEAIRAYAVYNDD